MPEAEPPRRLVTVESRKYDGTPHARYQAELVALGGGAAPLHLFVPVGTHVVSHSRGPYEVATAFTQLFWPDLDRWWNVEHNHWPHPRSSGGVILTYANVATQTEFDGETVRWVDLDLDLIVGAEGPRIVDRDEFEEHQRTLAYPPEIIARAEAAAAELLALALAGTPPLDRSSYVP